MGRFRWVAVTAVLASVAVLLAVLAFRSPARQDVPATPVAAEVTVESITETLLQCIPEGADIGVPPDEPHRVMINCLSKTLNDAALVGKINEAATAAVKAGERNPYLQKVCHTPAHNSGVGALEYAGGDPYKAITTFDWNLTCGGAFVHGITNAVAVFGLDMGKFEEVIRGCDEYPEESQRVYCIHNVGHGAWRAADGDFVAALDPCYLVEDFSEKVTCVQGMIIEAYQPGNDVKHEEPSASMTDMPPFCNSLREKSEGIWEGCVLGAAWALTRIVYFDVLYPASQRMAPPYDGITEAEFDRMTEVSNRAYAVCDEFEGGVEKCRQLFAEQAVLDLGGFFYVDRVKAAICDLPDAALSKRCVATPEHEMVTWPMEG